MSNDNLLKLNDKNDSNDKPKISPSVNVFVSNIEYIITYIEEHKTKEGEIL